MRLLLDSVLVRSWGALHLRDELASALAHAAPNGAEVVLLADSPPKIPEQPGLEIRIVDPPAGGLIGKWAWHHMMLPKQLAAYRADVLYTMTGVAARRVVRRVPTVLNFNNMLPFTKPDPKARDSASTRARNLLLRRTYIGGIRRAHSVVLHSRHALDVVSAHAPELREKTFVALTGVPADVRGGGTVGPNPHGSPYALYVSTFFPYKNHLRLIEGYTMALGEELGLPDLLLAGAPGHESHFKQVMDAIDVGRARNRIQYVGELDRHVIGDWFRHATMNLFPSTCETNPVALSEILACGGVLAAASAPPMPEITQNGAVYFDPYSPRSIADAVLELMRNPDLREDLRVRARARAEQLSWEQCARSIWEAAGAAHARFWSSCPA